MPTLDDKKAWQYQALVRDFKRAQDEIDMATALVKIAVEDLARARKSKVKAKQARKQALDAMSNHNKNDW